MCLHVQCCVDLGIEILFYIFEHKSKKKYSLSFILLSLILSHNSTNLKSYFNRIRRCLSTKKLHMSYFF